MKNNYIINWELSLKCNLSCSFCSQEERRNVQNKELDLNSILLIINNLPNNSHISFLWWETLLFKDISKVFKKLNNLWITYELTTNWTLLKSLNNNIKEYTNLKQVNISIDWYWDIHDKSRWKKWLFDIIIKEIPTLLMHCKVSISTVITKITTTNLVKLHLKLNELWIQDHKLIYCMNFSKTDIKNSKIKIKELEIFSPWIVKIDNTDYKKEFIRKFLFLKKIKTTTKVTIEPEIIIKEGKLWCKQIDNQYRINEKWELTICEFINNNFSNLINQNFEETVKNSNFLNLKSKIISNFPLDICKTCCKLYIKK